VWTLWRPVTGRQDCGAGISYSHMSIVGTASTFTGSLSLNRKVFFGLYGKNSESAL
jgi:hypothetical protein